MNFTTDKNGFIRFNIDEFFKNRAERLQKMFGYKGTIANWYPDRMSDNWEKYPYKNYKATHYVEPYTACPAEVFCDRYFKKVLAALRNKWIRISYIDRYYGRKCTTLCVFDVEWKNYESGQSISISGFTLDGSLVHSNIGFDDLCHIAIKICSDDESAVLMNLVKTYLPEPIYPMFKIYHEYYSNNYDKYVNDCKQHNIKPLPKIMIDKLSKDIVISVKDETIGGENEDTYIVNIKPED